METFIEAIEAGDTDDDDNFSPSALRRRKEGGTLDGTRSIKSFMSRDGDV